MELKYKTRGMTPPRGKAWVYLCCHPSEVALFADTVGEELLARQDCAVWYPEDPTAERDEAFFAALGEMQLVVMPVTRRLLEERSPAIAEEFAFAIERRIPVLPLMQENGLDELFGAVCGSLQYLDPNAQDDTALRYDEKLDKYLNSVLIGDALAAKIRAAFDAYVFLSYRKKDRAHAQELMRLIHRNEFCRDIAIWYDEFLTPGEDWSEAIGEALRESDLFVLAVTPNLVSEKNYVMTEEYPLARRVGKRILPAELVPTDRALLAEKYEGIPDCTDAHDASSLAAALAKAFEPLAVRENDTPEHRFFIGLAYLGGVDVEVDFDAAVRLITEAAEGGVAEAAEKLVSMYYTGHGVARSYETALAWQERAVALRQAALDADDTLENLDALFWCLLALGDYYRDFRRHDKAKDVFFRSVALLETRSGSLLWHHNALAYNRLGNVLLDAGDQAGAREAYEEYYRYSERCANKWADREHYRNCEVACNKLGELCCAEGDFAAGKTYFEKALAIAERLMEDAPTAQARRDVSISYERLGEVSRAAGDDEGARRYFEKDHHIIETLAKELGTPDAERDLAISSYRLGQLLEEQGDREAAEPYLLKDLAISQNLHERLGTETTERDLALSHYSVGNFYESGRQPERAIPHLETAIAMQRAFVAQANLPEDRMHWCATSIALGNAHNHLGDEETAYAVFAEALPVARTLAKQWPVMQAKKQVYRLFSCVLLSLERRGRHEEMLRLAEEGVPVMRAYAEETGAAYAWYNVSYFGSMLGDHYLGLGQPERAKPLYEENLFVCKALAEQGGRADELDELALAYYRVATLDDERRADCLREAIAIYEKLVAAFPQVSKYRNNLEELKTM